MALVAALRPAIFNRDGASFDPAEFAQSLQEGGDFFAHGRWRAGAQEPDSGQLAGLSPHGQRPRRRPTNKRNELAPPHWSPHPRWLAQDIRSRTSRLGNCCIAMRMRNPGPEWVLAV